jgi:hypothetical protein
VAGEIADLTDILTAVVRHGGAFQYLTREVEVMRRRLGWVGSRLRWVLGHWCAMIDIVAGRGICLDEIVVAGIPPARWCGRNVAG